MKRLWREKAFALSHLPSFSEEIRPDAGPEARVGRPCFAGMEWITNMAIILRRFSWIVSEGPPGLLGYILDVADQIFSELPTGKAYNFYQWQSVSDGAVRAPSSS
jgi:hypothetical protein